MLRFWVIVVLVVVVKSVSTANTIIPELRSELRRSTDIPQRQRLQRELILLKDSNVITHLSRTATMDLSTEEKYENLYQYVRYYTISTRIPDSARLYYDRLKSLKIQRDSFMLCMEAILNGRIEEGTTRGKNLKPDMVKYAGFVYRNSAQIPVWFEQEYYTYLTRLYSYEGIVDSASYFVQLAQRAQAKPLAHPVLQYRTSFILAQLFTNLGNYSDALKELERIKPLVSRFEVPYDMANYHAMMGRVLTSLLDDDLALTHYNICIEIAERYNYKNVLGSAYPNRFISLASLGRYEEAIKQYDKTVSWHETNRQHMRLPGLMLNKAEMELKLQNFDAARTDWTVHLR